MHLLNPYWARKRIEQLDPEKDAREIAHLAFEVRYGTPLFTHSLFSIAFARQAAVPSIAKVLYRGGKGGIITNPRKRNNDTLLFFGEFFRHGDSAEGLKAVELLNHIHSYFPITNNENLYTLATLVCEPVRMAKFLTGRNIFTEKELRGLYMFWRRMAELMNITGVPDNEHQLMEWYETYERENFAYSEEGLAVVQALAGEFADRWHPGPTRPIGINYYYALFDDHLRSTYQLPPTPAFYVKSVKAMLTFYLTVFVKYMPDASDRSIIDYFSKDYPDYHISKVGPFPPSPTTATLPGRFM
ncbi:MAG: oxygenase MpaB family protein [Chitinophagales bacterium]